MRRNTHSRFRIPIVLGLIVLTSAQRARADITYAVPSVSVSYGTSAGPPVFETGAPPIGFTYTGGGDGITTQITYDSSYALTSYASGPFSQTSIAQEGMTLDVGGQSALGDHIEAYLDGEIDVTAYLSSIRSNVNYFAAQTASLQYHLVAGDTLYYNVFSEVSGDDFFNFDPQFQGTISTPGDGTLNLDYPLTYIFNEDSFPYSEIGQEFVISVGIVRGEDSQGDSTVCVDPGITVGAMNASVPEPSSLAIVSVAGILASGVCMAKRLRRGKRPLKHA